MKRKKIDPNPKKYQLVLFRSPFKVYAYQEPKQYRVVTSSIGMVMIFILILVLPPVFGRDATWQEFFAWFVAYTVIFITTDYLFYRRATKRH